MGWGWGGGGALRSECVRVFTVNFLTPLTIIIKNDKDTCVFQLIQAAPSKAHRHPSPPAAALQRRQQGIWSPPHLPPPPWDRSHHCPPTGTTQTHCTTNTIISATAPSNDGAVTGTTIANYINTVSTNSPFFLVINWLFFFFLKTKQVTLWYLCQFVQIVSYVKTRIVCWYMV